MITVTKDNGATFNINYLEHMLHHNNLDNVLTNGLLSHNLAHQKGFIKQDISMSEVQLRRANKKITIDSKVYPLHDFVPFYFNSRNPMLYRRRNIQQELMILCIAPEIINRPLTIFSDGNAASYSTKFYIGAAELKNIPFELTTSGSWNHNDENIKRENVRKMCAEVLTYESVEVSTIQKIVCPNETMRQYAQKVKEQVGSNVAHITVEIGAGWFFL